MGATTAEGFCSVGVSVDVVEADLAVMPGIRILISERF